MLVILIRLNFLYPKAEHNEAFLFFYPGHRDKSYPTGNGMSPLFRTAHQYPDGGVLDRSDKERV